MGQPQLTVPGRVNDAELAQIQEPLAAERESFSEYITVAEIAWLTRISKGRIYHALTYAQKRPLSGIKRGPLWFVRKLEALRWASAVARWEIDHWESRFKRI